MPNLELEKALRQAVVKIRDEATYEHACTLIDNPEVDINGSGPESGKTALNFALDSLFIPLLNNQDTSRQVVEFRLRIIDKLLAAKADLNALQHSKTTLLLKALNKASDICISNIKTRIASLTKPEDYNPVSFLANLSPHQKLLIITHHMFNVLLKMAQLIKSLEAEHEANTQAGYYKKISNKLILLMENHDDEGTYLFVERYKKQLIESKYVLCLELPFNSTDYATKYSDVLRKSKFLQLAFYSDFSTSLNFIDPTPDYKSEDTIKLILDIYSKNFFCAETRMALRDKGMSLLICKAALKHDGKIIAPVGALHIMIIRYLTALEIPFAVASPFTDPASLDLIKSDDGSFITKTDAQANLALLFRKFTVQPLHFVDAQEDTNAPVDRFVKLNFSFT